MNDSGQHAPGTPWQLHQIPGGIHPRYHKSQSADTELRQSELPELLTVPVSQHIGAASVPMVKPGDKVLKAQPIATSLGPISAPVHAPTSGVITAVGSAPVPHPSGLEALCIQLAPDGEERWHELQPIADFRAVERSALIARIRESGVTGLGGAGFPTAPKLGPRQDSPIDTLIINGVECEPYITADDILMRHRADAIISGIDIIVHLVGPQRVLIAVEDNKPKACKALREASSQRDYIVVETPTMYPSGGEKQLVQLLLGQEIPAGQLPASIGVLCQNVGTAAAIHDAVVRGEPLISRITTVTGDAVTQPGNYRCLLGTPVDHLLRQGGLAEDRLYRLVMGGPMMGFTLTNRQVPVVKTTNCLLAATAEELPPPPPAQPCIRCGICAEACPASLLPQQLYWFARADDHEKLESHHLFDCIECGACSWVCPSNIPLVQYYRSAKGQIREKREENRHSEIAQQRFEAHQQRIEKEAEERERKRAARRSAATKDGMDDAVAAAIARAKQRQAAQTTDGEQQIPEKPAPEQLQRRVDTLRKSVDKASLRIAEAEAANADTLPALQAALERTRLKLQQAEQQLEAVDDQEHGDKTSPTAEGTAATDDAAQSTPASPETKTSPRSETTDPAQDPPNSR